MGTDGACSLLFFAAKRSGAFPPNMPTGLWACAFRAGYDAPLFFCGPVKAGRGTYKAASAGCLFWSHMVYPLFGGGDSSSPSSWLCTAALNLVQEELKSAQNTRRSRPRLNNNSLSPFSVRCAGHHVEKGRYLARSLHLIK